MVTKIPSKNDIPMQQVANTTCLKRDRQMSSKEKFLKKKKSINVSVKNIDILEEILNMSTHKNLKVNKDSKGISIKIKDGTILK